MFKTINLWMLLGLISLGLTVTSCDDDDDDDMDEDIASLTVDDQVTSQNAINVGTVDIPEDGFVVVHRDDNGGPMVPDIISEPVYVEEGQTNNVSVPILDTESLTDGETLWVMLHMDTGEEQVYTFDGTEDSEDNPYTTEDGNIVMTPIEISSANITVSDQEVNNNSVTIDEVTAAVDGWLVVHNDDGTGNIVLPGIIGKTMVEAGTTSDVVVELEDSISYTPGQKLFPMLHIDNGTIGEYEFDGSSGTNDGPEIFSNDDFPANVIFTSFTVE